MCEPTFEQRLKFITAQRDSSRGSSKCSYCLKPLWNSPTEDHDKCVLQFDKE